MTPRWQEQCRRRIEHRWTVAEISELQAELMRRHLLDPLWAIASDALGSQGFDLVDALRDRAKPPVKQLETARTLARQLS